MKKNFSPGPARLPDVVRAECDASEQDFEKTGMRASDIPHRHKKVEAMLAATRALFIELLGIPETHTVLLLEGGATTHFTVLPQQLRWYSGFRKARIGYVDGGYWSNKALKACRMLSPVCDVSVLATSKEEKYTTIPSIIDAYQSARDAEMEFFFFNANETTNGTQVFQGELDALGEGGSYPIVDMTSELFSRTIDVSKFGAIIASAQKNFGKQGLTAIIIRKDLIAPCPWYLPSTLNYAFSNEKSGGPPNTFNVPTLFSLYAMLRWIKSEGGVAVMEGHSRLRSKLLYDALDHSGLFEGIAVPERRSVMNVIFRLKKQVLEKDPTLHDRFVQKLQDADIASFNGHREVNDLYGPHFRISLYNGISLDQVQYLVDVMKEFERRS